MTDKIKLYLLIIALFVPLAVISKEEQNDLIIFQQYKQDTVKPYDYSYNDNFMNFMPFPYLYHGYRHGFFFIGNDYLYDAGQYNRYLLKDMPQDTLVSPKEYPTILERPSKISR